MTDPTRSPRPLTRRAALKLGSASAMTTAMLPRLARSSTPPARHGYSPLGPLAYGPDFEAFGDVNANAPKGGMLRTIQIETFDSLNLLHYRGRPIRDIAPIYDRLLIEAADEVASFYGLLAREIQVADDHSHMDIWLDPTAHWQDGVPVTALDVVFTFETLAAEGLPFYRQALLPLTVTALDRHRVRIDNSRSGYRDLPRLISQVHIHPAHFWDHGADVGPDRLPLGSGPYRLTDVDMGRRLVLERNLDYWGAGLSVNRGRWNFDRITIDYHLDEDVGFEAFRAGDVDLWEETSATRWTTGYSIQENGQEDDPGAIIRTSGPRPTGDELHGIVFNHRRPLLADRRVRIALTLAYSFDSVNRTLFSSAYAALTSVFGDSSLAAQGNAGPDERAFFRQHGIAADHPMLSNPDPLTGFAAPGTRAALAEAARLLDEAGLAVEDGRRIDPATGTPVTLDVVSMRSLYDPTLIWLGDALERVGIGLRQIRVDRSSATRMLLDKNFDLATLSWSATRLPGSSERLLWHSALADMPQSYALSGVRDPMLDAAIDLLGSARTRADLTIAGRVFDRTFRHAVPMLPLWRTAETWLAYRGAFGRPTSESNGVPAEPMERWWSGA